MATTPVWFVTGAGTGFGREIALEALRRGHSVIATARSLSKLSNLKEAGAATMELDVTASEDVVAAKIKEAKDIYGHLTVLVCAAGYVLGGAVEEASEKETFDQFNTNVFGTIRVIRAAMPYLRATAAAAVTTNSSTSPPPTIITFGSLASWIGTPGVSFYCATKWAISGFSESLALELADVGVRVLLVEPGYFRTAFLNDGKRIQAAKRMDDVYGEDTIVSKEGERLTSANNKQIGDVVKGSKTVVELVVGEKGEMPTRILLGSDCVKSVREKCQSVLEMVNTWEGVSSSTDHED